MSTERAAEAFGSSNTGTWLDANGQSVKLATFSARVIAVAIMDYGMTPRGWRVSRRLTIEARRGDDCVIFEAWASKLAEVRWTDYLAGAEVYPYQRSRFARAVRALSGSTIPRTTVVLGPDGWVAA